jgi:hypothetical protein
LWSAPLSFGRVHIVGTGGSIYFPMSYGGSKRGGGCFKKSLYSLRLIISGVETLNFVQCHFHLEICILLGWEDPIMSYGRSKRGGGCARYPIGET